MLSRSDSANAGNSVGHLWVKICGVTTEDDARMVAAAGADAVGLNFYQKSRRYIAPNDAAKVRAVIGSQMEVVGVFVNSSPQQTAAIAESVGLSAVQFHGDESIADISEFHRLAPDTGIIRAFRIGDSGTAEMSHTIEQFRAAEIPLKGVLVDALVSGEYGGTGRQVAPELLQNRKADGLPLILAGGLTPDTVSDAIAAVRPWGVDTASGVESAPGIKCPERVADFVARVRAAQQSD